MKSISIKEWRQKLGLNQQQFWSPVGVTQSAGSRYESGRRVPAPLSRLLSLVHTGKVTIEEINAASKIKFTP